MLTQWRQTLTIWRALENGYAVNVFENCCLQPASLAQLSPYSLDESGMISQATTAFVPVAAAVKIRSGLDYLLEGDHASAEAPPPDALRIIGVKDYSAFRLPHYELIAQ